MGQRFRKAVLLEILRGRVDALSKQAEELGLRRRLDPGNGWSQVEGRGEELNRLYGKWDALRNLLEEIECF